MTSQQRLTHIGRPEGVIPGPGYSHVVTGTGRLVAVSGQVAIGEDGQIVGPGDPSAQARQVFENLQVVALVRPEFLLEVEAFALAGDGR